MDLCQYSKFLATLVNWNSVDQLSLRDVLAYNQDTLLERFERHIKQRLTQRYDQCLALARWHVKFWKDTWDTKWSCFSVVWKTSTIPTQLLQHVWSKEKRNLS